MNEINELFFQLIRVAIGTQDMLTRAPSAEEWAELYAMAKKQSLVGICFAGVQRLGNASYENQNENENRLEPSETLETYWNLPEMQYLTWMGMAAKIQQRNEIMNGYTHKALTYFREKGFPCQVLKGQGLAKLYGSLAGLRQSGDVDVWLDCSRKELFELSKKEFGRVEGYNGFHIHYPLIDDCEIEAHFIPGAFSSPFSNRAFRKFCEMNKPIFDNNDDPSTGSGQAQSINPKPFTINLNFNLVYIMQHCYNHLCGHGVGMRQVMDYYYVLRTSYENQNDNENLRDEVLNWIKALGMYRFATAMMWVMKEVFGLEDEYLLCEPDEKLGRFLLSEIMMTGNMGHYDERVKAGTWGTAMGRYWYNLKRTIYLMRICPQEVLWRPWMSLISYVKIKFQQ